MKRRRDQRFENRGTPETDEEDTIRQTPAPGADTEDLAANSELRRLIETAVHRFPDSCRTVFMLRAIEQLSIEETAAYLDIPAATVKTRFHRA
jgi:RNA polymerase sigma-70 factor (ECF subfamily)